MAESDNILTKLQDLLVYLIPQLNKFPRDQKLATCGQTIQRYYQLKNMKTSNFRHRRAAALWLPLVLFAFMPLADGQTFEVLQSVSASLIQGRDGNIYGRTSETLFKLAANGALTTLASISNATNGLGPMVQGSDGNFYGTTVVGGDRSLNNGNGFGTVFKMTTNGMVTTLFAFRNDSNGMYPVAALVLGSDESFYGTTQGSEGSTPYGTVFKITTDGTLTTLARFNREPPKTTFRG